MMIMMMRMDVDVEDEDHAMDDDDDDGGDDDDAHDCPTGALFTHTLFPCPWCLQDIVVVDGGDDDHD